MPQHAVIGRLVNDPDLEILTLKRFACTSRYRIIVYRADQRNCAPVYRALVVDLDEYRYAVPGALAPQLPGLPITSRLLLVDGHIQLIGVIDPQLEGCALTVELAGTRGAGPRQRAGRAYPVENGVVVADLGPAFAELSVSQFSITGLSGEILWQAIGHPQDHLMAAATPLETLRWYETGPDRTLARFCRKPSTVVL